MKVRPLTAAQLIMLRCSAAGATGDEGGVVLLTGGNNWQTARSLESRGLGHIERGKGAGTAIGGRFFANGAGLDALAGCTVRR